MRAKTSDAMAEECVGAICGALAPLLVPTPSEAAAPARSRLKPGARSPIWPEGSALAVRGVLAGAYRGRHLEDGSTTPRTHAVLVDAEGTELGERTLCRRVPTGHLVDHYGMDGVEGLRRPTCEECARGAAR